MAGALSLPAALGLEVSQTRLRRPARDGSESFASAPSLPACLPRLSPSVLRAQATSCWPTRPSLHVVLVQGEPLACGQWTDQHDGCRRCTGEHGRRLRSCEGTALCECAAVADSCSLYLLVFCLGQDHRCPQLLRLRRACRCDRGCGCGGDCGYVCVCTYTGIL